MGPVPEVHRFGRVLNGTDSGWFGPKAMAKMPHFAEDFVCDPAEPHYGFTSWDDFFTRRFRPGVRPAASPADPNVIVNACESAPYRLSRDVRLRDRFWIKGQPYSVAHMLADDPWAGQFADGTIYQAFLSALSYHRWHSPVDGRVVKAYVRDGTYYSEIPAEEHDPAGPDESQGYFVISWRETGMPVLAGSRCRRCRTGSAAAGAAGRRSRLGPPWRSAAGQRC
jgi:phosphatidylserine decarboxylase